jgi:hypothetical protein
MAAKVYLNVVSTSTGKLLQQSVKKITGISSTAECDFNFLNNHLFFGVRYSISLV